MAAVVVFGDEVIRLGRVGANDAERLASAVAIEATRFDASV
jgi:hypothetical protein